MWVGRRSKDGNSKLEIGNWKIAGAVVPAILLFRQGLRVELDTLGQWDVLRVSLRDANGARRIRFRYNGCSH